MLIRALIVLLIALNLGAAAWWITRPVPPPSPPPATPREVARLKLLSESTPAPAIAPVVTPPVQTPAEPPVAAAAPPQCFSLGPFADATAASAAVARLGKQATRLHPREVPGRAASGYNVYLPPSSDRETAQAVAQRISAAGFDDYLVIDSGELTNGIALGRYRSRESAEGRQSALQAAGFPAQVQPIGEESVAQWWLDLAAVSGTAGPQLQALASVAQARSLDCATLR